MRGGIMHKVVADDSIHYFAVRSNSDEKTLEDHHFSLYEMQSHRMYANFCLVF